MEKRNDAVSINGFSTSLGIANWSEMTISKAVKDGYKISGWVYTCVSMIAKHGSSVPWHVYDKKGTKLDNHPLSKLFANPNPHFSRQDIFELLIAWRQLGGEAYLYKNLNENSKRTEELWPISPDRLSPITTTKAGKLFDGYEYASAGGQKKRSEKYNEDNIIHSKMLNPADPLHGISPLQAEAQTVDIDTEQKNFNKAAMQNRGVIDGVFSFKRDLTKDQHDTVMQKIKEKVSGFINARMPLVVGSDATYTRLALTPVEMDFLESRRFNREQIFAVYKVPLQLSGSEASSTFNNFAVAMRILWVNAVIPELRDLADTLNRSFAGELGEGEYIKPDLSGVEALRDSETEVAELVRKFFEMGVPMSVLNARYELGFEAFAGWDKPFAGKKQEASADDNKEKRFWQLVPFETRSVEKEQAKRDKMAEGEGHKLFTGLLDKTRAALFSAMDSGGDDIAIAVAMESVREDWEKGMDDFFRKVAFESAGNVVVGERGEKPNYEVRATNDNAIDEAVDQILLDEQIILADLKLINDYTAQAVVDQIAEGIETGMTVQVMKDALMDLGIFSPERALVIARTTAGTAASVGQYAAGKTAGATKKVWMNSGFEVRQEHINRGGEKVDIDGRFSQQFSGGSAPRWPLDPQSHVADRVNCRCSLTFE